MIWFCYADNRALIGARAAAARAGLGESKRPTKGNARRRRIENYLMVNHIEVSDFMELDTMHGTLGLVANSDWVTILPGIMCQPDLDGTRRKVAPLADPPLMVDYMRIEARKRPLSAAAQPFADILQEELNSALEIEPFSHH